MRDLTVGSETKAILFFSFPLMAGNLLQQMYNIVDTIIVGQCLGENALAAVGAAYSFMVLLTSVLLGLCMGCGVVFSYFYGAQRNASLQASFYMAFVWVGAIAAAMMAVAFLFLPAILDVLQTPQAVFALQMQYLQVILLGLPAVFFYNYAAAVLRSMGNSVWPLIALAVSAVLNIGLDILFVLPLKMGVAGAAWATVIAQGVSAVVLWVYLLRTSPDMRAALGKRVWDKGLFAQLRHHSVWTSIQQSIMNFGILMVQGLVNRFGVAAMAGFAAAVKVDGFAYMPMQDFGNAFPTYVAQNRGAGKPERVRSGLRKAVLCVTLFGACISALVVCLARPLVGVFLQPTETQAIAVGMQYLHTVAPFYCLIGYLFLFYGLYRGVGRAGVSVVLTMISLGTRVALAYALAAIPAVGLAGVWWAVPIGWALADAVGLALALRRRTARETAESASADGRR